MAPPRSNTRVLVILCLAALLLAGPAWAHRVSSVSLIAHLDTEKRTYLLDAAMEVVPSEDPAVNDQISPEDAAREFAGYLVVMFDEAEQEPALAIEIEETSDADTPPELKRQQVLTKLSGTIPEGAKEFLLYLDPRCPMAVVMVVIKDEQPSRRMQVILSGEYSRPVSVVPVEEGDPFAETAGAVSAPSPDPVATAVTERGGVFAAFATGARMFFSGSALPVLLALATLLLTLGRTSVLWQTGILLAGAGLVSALAAWGLIGIRPEAGPVLAGLTALLALEAVVHRHLRWWRILALAVAGPTLGLFLVDSVDFRSFVAPGQPGSGRVVLLVLGVECALLATILLAAAVLLPLSRREWYRKAVVAPLAVLVAGAAIFSAVERFL